MEIIEEIRIRKIKNSRAEELDSSKLDFGSFTSDHMFICKYHNDEWQDMEITPYENLSLSPATIALHYGQSIFEGMKAFRMEDDRINIFRIEKHHERLSRSLDRMCMPPISLQLFSSALKQLVKLDQDWVPSLEGASLYIRPLIFASEGRFGFKVSDEYIFLIFTGPVAPFFSKPLKLKVEREFIRAAKGGTGYAKCAGNYGGAFYPTQLARLEGYDQVLWTDAKTNEFIEESGMMNVMFVINDVLITPPLSDSILDGITRDSLLKIAADMGVAYEERPISISELTDAFLHKKISEAFGTGTAAIVAPISTINIDGWDFILPPYTNNQLMFRLKNKLDNIRFGKEEDKFGWNTVL
ncbi:MAG: branched-chain amino acid aminotransferase [Flavisolibacter sp.]